jgi:hypothetical protein
MAWGKDVLDLVEPAYILFGEIYASSPSAASPARSEASATAIPSPSTGAALTRWMRPRRRLGRTPGRQIAHRRNNLPQRRRIQVHRTPLVEFFNTLLTLYLKFAGETLIDVTLTSFKEV